MAPDHRYAKLVPEAVGDMKALAEGEGRNISFTFGMKDRIIDTQNDKCCDVIDCASIEMLCKIL